ncbi:MAG: type I-MYXAN CRISPR-associated protein Cas6/Cmx6 [Chromatiales bacterium]|jgi:CRISPR-associated protein Cas6
MFWQEENPKDAFQVPDDLVDVLFSLKGRQIPVDHAYALSAALQDALPWLAGEPEAAVHLIHVAGSQNGWERPEDLLHLSRRTKLVLRLPAARLEDARGLVGRTLDLSGHAVEVGDFTTRPLSRQGTVFARYVVSDRSEDESAFLERMAAELSAMAVRIRKALCGKSAVIRTPDGPVHTRSLMLADLTPEESIRVQRQGLGTLRKMGCGIFIPHKGIAAVRKADE